MQYILTNAGPILLATCAGLLVSAVYAGLAGGGAETGRGSRAALALLAFVAQGWLACILAGALILAPHQASAWVMALGSAVVIWIGFVLPALAVTLRFRGVRTPAALCDGGLWLAVMLAQAAVLQLVGLKHP